MKNLKNTLLIIALVACTFVGCGKTTEISEESDIASVSQNEAEIKLENITVRTAEQNDKNAWCVQWPSVAVTDSFSNFSNKLENATVELSKDQIEYFINYVESIDVMDNMDKHINNISKEDYEGHKYLGSVEIIYNDENDNFQRITRYIFDEYPDGYDEFIEKFSEICGEDFITLNYNMQEVTADYFRRMARISDEVPDEIVEEFLDIAECDMFELLEDYNYYAAQSGIDYINTYRHLPKELSNEASTENELKEYVTDIAGKFDIDESRIFENKESGYYFSSAYGNFEIYPSNMYPHPEYIQDYKWECSKAHFYNIQDNSGPEGMITAYYFVYSNDGKFMIVIPDSNSETTNEIIKTIFDE